MSIPAPFVSLVGIPTPGVAVDATQGARTALIAAGWTPPNVPATTPQETP